MIETENIEEIYEFEQNQESIEGKEEFDKLEKNNNIKPKGKRGRKSKKELLEIQNQMKLHCEQNQYDNYGDISGNESEEKKEDVKIPKKRGRKPNGGKIISQSSIIEEQIDEKQNVILCLRCNMSDLEKPLIENDTLDAYNNHICNEVMYNYNPNVIVNDKINNVNNNNNEDDYNDDDYNDDNNNMKEISKKIKQLEYKLHINNIVKKSCCFWDTCDFDNPPIYIPKYYLNGTYHVYGCFCSPECAVAYLMNEHIDRSAKAERYQLLNDIYSKIYKYDRGIKEASDPRYLLDKFLGDLTIQEYRSLLRNERLYFVIDKPLTRVFPELHEDNEDFILNNKIIPSNSSLTNQVKNKLYKKKPNKITILNEKFGITSNN